LFPTALQHDVVIEIRPRAANRGPRGQVFVRGVMAKGAARVMVVGAA
jgi:hypothetical protein